MLYQRRSFTCPASGVKTSDKNWDRAFLSEADFKAKYGDNESYSPSTPVEQSVAA